MKKWCGLIMLAYACLTATSANAAEIGRTNIGGRTAIIDSDGTWAYEDGGQVASDSSCVTGTKIKSKKLPIFLCLDKPWVMDTVPPGAMEFQIVHRDLDLYLGLIAERTQMELSGLKAAILYNAASVNGVRPDDVPILKESKETINGIEWSYIEYDVTVSGGKFRFGNFYTSLGERGVVQSVFWSNTVYFEENKPTILAKMAKIYFEK